MPAFPEAGAGGGDGGNGSPPVSMVSFPSTLARAPLASFWPTRRATTVMTPPSACEARAGSSSGAATNTVLHVLQRTLRPTNPSGTWDKVLQLAFGHLTLTISVLLERVFFSAARGCALDSAWR